MPALFVFLFKVNIALLLFCAGYYLVLRHLTFYTLNRIYLVTAILFATFYPKINLSGFLEHHQEIAKPVQVVAFNWQAPAKALVKPLANPDYWLWAGVVLWVGIALLALRLLVQLYSLYKLYRNSTAAQIYDHDVRVVNTDTGPFSFWKSIYVNPAKHEPSDLRSILQHEQIHVSEWHTLDVLLAELSTIFYWFNPGVWLMKKAVKENIEFITDRKILKTGTDSKQYQYSLVNVSFYAAPQGIVNHFNISTIKKRIIMMNAKRSSKFKLTRYALLVPVVVALLLVFSISKAALVTKSIKNIKLSSMSILAGKNIPATNRAANNTNTSVPPVAKKNKFQSKFVIKAIDTNRKSTFSIGSSNKLDSCNIVLNGIKVLKGALENINPDNIEAINVVSPGMGTYLIDKLDPTHGTIFITTKGSEAGSKFREKLDRLNNNIRVVNGSFTGHPGGNVSNVIVVGRNGGSSAASSSYSDSDNDVTVPGSGTTKVEAFNIVKSGSPVAVSTVTVRGNNIGGSGVRTYSSRNGKDSSGKVYSISADTVVFRSKANTKLYNITSGSGGRTWPNSNATYTYSPTGVGQVDHIADKMIIINGKLSTQADLKKISAFDIDKIVVKNDTETKELYGDKAKNGIVFIVTKKGGK